MDHILALGLALFLFFLVGLSSSVGAASAHNRLRYCLGPTIYAWRLLGAGRGFP